MAKFMIKASYRGDGTKALLKEGGSGRRAAVQKSLSAVGGKVDAFYYAFGEADVYAIIDVPDVITAAAVSLAVNATGRIELSTIPLLTPEDIDAACKKSVKYRAPGT